MLASEIPDPVPVACTDPAYERLVQARTSAVDALMQAEDLEMQLRTARRVARSRTKHYERLLAEYHGQLSVLDEEGVT